MIIPANKKRTPVLFILGIILLPLLVFLIMDNVAHLNGKNYDYYLLLGSLIGLFILLFLMTILAFLDYLKTTFNSTASITITDKGVNDNLSIFSVGNIEWPFITDVKIKTILKTDILVIEVTDPQLFIKRKNRLKQWPLKSFFRKYGSPIVVPQTRVDYRLTDLKRILIEAKNK